MKSIYRVMLMILCLFMPSLVTAEKFEKEWEKNGVKILIILEDEMNFFAGSELEYSISIPEGTYYRGH